MKRLIGFLIFTLLAFSVNASDCQKLYPNNTVIQNAHTGEDCKSFFVVVYDKDKHRPLFSSEYHVPSDAKIPREPKFYNNPNDNIDATKYPTLVNNNHYDRGHLTPAANASTAAQMHDTFDIINTAPQASYLNEHPWEQLEATVRTTYKTPLYILTGVIYTDDSMIPTSFYKIVYVPGLQPIVYIAYNQANGKPVVTTMQNIDQLTGFNF